MKRYAIIQGRRADADIIGRYLPSNYRVIWSGLADMDYGRPYLGPDHGGTATVVIGGEDHHGWTMHGYVIPRLGSGSIGATEIDLSHPAMSLIPA